MELQIILILLFNTNTVLGLINAVTSMMGRCAIVRKSGVKNHFHGLVPLYGEYLLSKCVNREADGRAYFAADAAYRLMLIASLVVPNRSLSLMLSILSMPLIMVMIVYQCRLYSGICELFGKRKWWVIIMLGLEGIPLLLWGLSKNAQPRWQVEEVDQAIGDFFSSAKAEVMDEGLTVNLDERSATEWFKKKVLLRDIHMYIKPGRMVLLLGGSGAGKTTLLNAINGYEKAKAEVHLNGSNVYSSYKRMQYDIGFVPQMDLMRGNDTVLHTLKDAATLRLPSEMYGHKRMERIDAVMTIFGLKPVAHNMVSKLSGGQRKRLSIAMEFLSNPSLFILDEPDSGLDGVMARELMTQLRSIADQGKIVIVITHTPDRVIDLFDDVIVLAKDKQRTGRLAYYGPIEEARSFFGKDTMEHIVLSINRKEEGGEGRADEFVEKYAEVMQNV